MTINLLCADAGTDATVRINIQGRHSTNKDFLVSRNQEDKAPTDPSIFRRNAWNSFLIVTDGKLNNSLTCPCFVAATTTVLSIAVCLSGNGAFSAGRCPAVFFVVNPSFRSPYITTCAKFYFMGFDFTVMEGRILAFSIETRYRRQHRT